MKSRHHRVKRIHEERINPQKAIQRKLQRRRNGGREADEVLFHRAVKFAPSTFPLRLETCRLLSRTPFLGRSSLSFPFVLNFSEDVGQVPTWSSAFPATTGDGIAGALADERCDRHLVRGYSAEQKINVYRGARGGPFLGSPPGRAATTRRVLPRALFVRRLFRSPLRYSTRAAPIGSS